jgi:3-hydroxymyristoyl/3-hydroxydecanoyl-(acyl carrier protein) dehydratase
MQLEMASRRNKIATMTGKAFVDGSLVAEAEMTAAIVDANNSTAEEK